MTMYLRRVLDGGTRHVASTVGMSDEPWRPGHPPVARSPVLATSARPIWIVGTASDCPRDPAVALAGSEGTRSRSAGLEVAAHLRAPFLLPHTSDSGCSFNASARRRIDWAAAVSSRKEPCRSRCRGESLASVRSKGMRRWPDPTDGLVGSGQIGGDHSGTALRERQCYRLTQALGGS